MERLYLVAICGLVILVASGCEEEKERVEVTEKREKAEVAVKRKVVAAPSKPGAGLKGEYFSGIDFEEILLTRADSCIDFDWVDSAPADSVPADNFSVRWTGFIDIPESGTYKFYTNSDDGVRLWVNGKEIISNWTLHGPTIDEAEIDLKKGKVPVKLEFYDAVLGAVIQLMWSFGDAPREVIPEKFLSSR